MGKSIVGVIVGVIVGYVAMFTLQVVTFMTVYMAVGADWSFKPASFQASTRWTLMQFLVIFVTAVIGGLVCLLLAKRRMAPLVLAGITLLLGFALAEAHFATQPPDSGELRPANVPAFVAMSKARHPVWVIFAGPVIAAIGIVVGGKLKKSKLPDAPADKSYSADGASSEKN